MCLRESLPAFIYSSYTDLHITFNTSGCVDVDPCYPNPCAHGECSELAGGYLCNCTLGFKGPQCSGMLKCILSN